MRRILLVDDDPTTHTIVEGILDEGLSLVSCYTMREANGALDYDVPCLAIIDRMLPDGDGIAICTRMKSEERLNEVPIIILSGKTSETDKVSGLYAGADDYITKPVGALELKARILARFRPGNKKISAGKLTIDLSSHRVFHSDGDTPREIELTRTEFKMLMTLARTPDRLFSRQALIDKVWGSEVSLSDRVVDTHMSHLRKKVAGTGVVIEALRGEGYRVVLEDSSDAKVNAKAMRKPDVA